MTWMTFSDWSLWFTYYVKPTARKWLDKVKIVVVFKLVPRWVVKWSIVRATVHAAKSLPTRAIPELTYAEIATAWEKK